MKLSGLFVVLVFTFCVQAGIQVAEANTAEITPLRTNPVPITKEQPKYPIGALQAGIEGWVVASFSVKADGTTDDIVVLRASIDHYFDKAVIETISAWTYKPATLNDAPVKQNNWQARMNFRIKNTQNNVSVKFRNLYKQAINAITNKDLIKARDLIQELDLKRNRFLVEVFYLDVLKAAYWQSEGNNNKILRFTERALVIADEVAPEAMYISLLRQAIVSNGISNNYGTALEHYETLKNVDSNLAPNDPIHNIIARINQTLEGDDPITTKGEVVQCASCRPPRTSWRHVLNRNSFSIDQVAGDISTIEIICDYHIVSLNHDPETFWHVNRDWGECDVRVFGEKGTTFQLLEYPDGFQSAEN